MNVIKHRILALLLLQSSAITLQAQIPDEVTEVLRKCAQAMGHPQGVEYEMSLKAKVALVTVLRGQINAFAKDKRNRFFFTMNVLGQHTKSAGGFDGVNQWKYFQGAEGDTIYVRKSDQKAKSDFDLNLHIDLEYRNATMKTHFGNYVITFTGPKDAGAPKKVTMTISGKDYMFREMETNKDGTTMTMKLTHLRFGVLDDIFTFDPNQYPDATIVLMK